MALWRDGSGGVSVTRRRVIVAVATLVAAAAVAGFAVMPGEASEDAVERTSTSAGPTSTTSTTEPPPATTTTTLPPLPTGGLSSGSSGPAVLALEQRLVERHYDPGKVDGKYDGATVFAVMALEKVAGMPPSGRVDAHVWDALANGGDPTPMIGNGGLRRVEIDKVRQVLFLYEEGLLTLISHVSTGSGNAYCAKGECGSAVTPAGSHRFLWRVNGWRQSRLGRLYNPVYFTSYGIAIHGFPSVPTHPASHGCVRIPMHTAAWFPSRVQEGDVVYVFDGETEVTPIERGDPDAPDQPVDDGGPPVTPPSDSRPWLDGTPPAPTPTTQPRGLLA